MPLEILKKSLASLGYRYDTMTEGGPKLTLPDQSTSTSMVTHHFFKPLPEFEPDPEILREIQEQLENAKRGNAKLSDRVHAFCTEVVRKARQDVRPIQIAYASATGHSVNTLADVVFHAKSGTPGVLLKLSIGNAEIRMHPT